MPGGVQLISVELEREPTCVAFSPDGMAVAVGDRTGRARLFRADTEAIFSEAGVTDRDFVQTTPHISALAFAPGVGALIAATSGDAGGRPNVVGAWDVASGEWLGDALTGAGYSDLDVSEEQGGFLMLFNSEDPSDLHRVLPPTHNCIVGFAISERSNHAVSTTHGGERYTLVYSFYGTDSDA